MESVLVSNIKTKQQRDIVNEFKTHWKPSSGMQTLLFVCHPQKNWAYVSVASDVADDESFIITFLPNFKIFKGLHFQGHD